MVKEVRVLGKYEAWHTTDGGLTWCIAVRGTRQYDKIARRAIELDPSLPAFLKAKHRQRHQRRREAGHWGWR